MLDSFITLAFLSSMLLFLAFMCRDSLRRDNNTNTFKPRGRHSFNPVFPSVSKKKDRTGNDAADNKEDDNNHK